MEQPEPYQVTSLADLMSDESQSLFDASGPELVRRMGMDTVKTVVSDVLSGKNLRDSTEVLTRRRLAALNAATVAMFLKGAEAQPDFVNQLPSIAARILKQKRLSKSEKWVAQWALGLTGKASQNVLRDDASLLAEYKERYVATCEDVIRESITEFDTLGGEIRLGDDFFYHKSQLGIYGLLAGNGWRANSNYTGVREIRLR